MSNEKFTQGEWRVEEGYYDNAYEVAFGNDGYLIAEYVYTKEDAHLIAAAPDLYRALEKIAKQHRKHYGLDGAWDSVLSNAEKALTKARGEL